MNRKLVANSVLFVVTATLLGCAGVDPESEPETDTLTDALTAAPGNWKALGGLSGEDKSPNNSGFTWRLNEGLEGDSELEVDLRASGASRVRVYNRSTTRLAYSANATVRCRNGDGSEKSYESGIHHKIVEPGGYVQARVECKSGQKAVWASGYTGVYRVESTWTLSLKSTDTGQCVDARNGVIADYTPVQIWPCNGTAAQKWRGGENSPFRIGDHCMDTEGATHTGAPVTLQRCSGRHSQQWSWRYDTQELFHPASGLCLKNPDPNPQHVGTQLLIATCRNTFPEDRGQNWIPWRH